MLDFLRKYRYYILIIIGIAGLILMLNIIKNTYDDLKDYIDNKNTYLIYMTKDDYNDRLYIKYSDLIRDILLGASLLVLVITAFRMNIFKTAIILAVLFYFLSDMAYLIITMIFADFDISDVLYVLVDAAIIIFVIQYLTNNSRFIFCISIFLIELLIEMPDLFKGSDFSFAKILLIIQIIICLLFYIPNKIENNTNDNYYVN